MCTVLVEQEVEWWFQFPVMLYGPFFSIKFQSIYNFSLVQKSV